LELEQVPGGGFLSLCYGTAWGRFITDSLWSRIFISRFYGLPFHMAWSRRCIEPFVRQNQVSMDEVEVPAGGFASFNDFFIRRLKPGARPIPADPEALIAPADSRLKIFPLNSQTVLDIKGNRLTLADLVGTADVAQRFLDGTCLQFRLAPCDYHRFGYICDGVQGAVHNVPGRLYSVSPLALAFRPSIWSQNFRQWCLIGSDTLGPVLEIDVGATGVGSIVQQQPSGGPCERGSEKGYFQLGGSTVLIILQPGRIELDADITKYSNRGIETLVRYGEKIGRLLR
jgi:phosphatidylserine decarboxylase